MISLLIKEVYNAKGIPFLKLHNQQAEREMLLGATKDQLLKIADVDARLMEQMQAYIGLRGGENSSENSDVPSEKLSLYYSVYWEPVHGKIRVNKTKWVVLRYPTPSMAQAANMSTRAFEDYYFNVCNLDYSKMDKAMDALKVLMEKTDDVRIVGKNTDLSFSIKGIPAIKCAGKMNIPDGEIFTAPVRDSVNGYISYNTPSLEEGFYF